MFTWPATRSVSALAMLALVGCVGAPLPGDEATLEIVSPAEGDQVAGPVPLVVTLDPADELEELEAFANEVRVARSPRLPLIAPVRLDTVGAGDGPITLRVVATLADGRRASSEVVVQVDTEPPALELLSPADESFHFVEDEPFTFSVRAHDGSGLESGTLFAGDRVVGAFAPLLREELVAEISPASLVPAGATGTTKVELRAEVRDRVGRSSTITAHVNVRSRLHFRFDTLGRIETRPEVLADGAVAVGSSDRFLYVVEPSGVERCRADVGEVVGAPRQLPDGGAIVVGSTTALRAVSPVDCHVLWTFGTAGVWRAGPTIGPDGTIYAATFEGALHAIGPGGAARWQQPLDGNAQAAPALSPSGTILVGTLSGVLHTFAPDGTPGWRFTAPAEIGAPALATETGVYFGSYDLHVYGLDPSGARLWPFELATDGFVQCAPALLRSGDVVTCSRDGGIYAIGARSGEARWEHHGVGYTYGGVEVGPDGTVYAGGVDGALVALGGEGQPRWTFQAHEEIVARPAAGNGLVYFGSADRKLYALWADGVPPE